MIRPILSVALVALAAAGAAGPSRSEIRAATAALAAEGYAPGPVNGDWGDADAAALRAYQADWRLPETGELTSDLLARLTRQAPETRPHMVETDGGCRVWDRYPQPQETVTWTGPCVDGMTSGTGLLTWRSVHLGETRIETYRGERRDGRENGQGVYTAADGGRYDGGWRDGLKSGHGTYTSPEGDVYVGEYLDGARNGHGTYTRADGSRYEGEWKDGTEDGEGIAVWRDGSRYEGHLRDGKPDGLGRLTFPGGAVYAGEWHEGCFAGALRGATAGVTSADCGWE